MRNQRRRRPGARLLRDESVGKGGQDEYSADGGVDLKECPIDCGDRSFACENVLVDETGTHQAEAEEVNSTEPRRSAKKQKTRQGQRMQQCRQGKRSGEAEPDNHRVQPLPSVHVQILRGVNDIKSRDPAEEPRFPEQAEARQTPGHGKPGSDRRNRQRRDPGKTGRRR